ncbi:alcohol dehydrogenase [Penicillium odoratum]|uniref:alcohol dehydrogenase n=1 Tax=Penicillium odoratum TaxID=1167516 RepID=UPI00254934B9|nr:alcohol dehydrogenase [Penicillium odoratum]KAJ5745465.1 alcohol dehydrogenase [Penicillium odoratum]
MAVKNEIPETMLAAVIEAFNEPIKIQEVKVPDTPDERILVKIEAGSLCSSDLMAWKGYMPYLTSLPYCGGHEPVGTIVKIGSAVRGFTVGERVGFIMFTDMCGVCDECFSGEHRYCAQKKAIGFQDSYGGFSEYSLADPRSTVKLPDELSFESAAPLFCGGVTAYSALLRVRASPGQLINIIGCGGVGHLAIMFAKKMGYRIHAYDISEEKLALARDCGADQAFDSLNLPSNPEKAASTLVISGASAAYNSAVGLTANHGAVVAVGIPPTDIQVSASNTGSKADLIALLDLAARHNIKPVIDVRNIRTVNEAYQDLANGKIDGRIVFKFN